MGERVKEQEYSTRELAARPYPECGHFQYYTLIFNNNTAVMFQTRLTSMTLWLFFSSYSIKPDFLRLLLGGLLLLLPLALITFYVSFITVHQKKKKNQFDLHYNPVQSFNCKNI